MAHTHIHLSIPEDVRAKIGQYRGRANWSQVATAAFRKTIEEIEEKDRLMEEALRRTSGKTAPSLEAATPSASGPAPLDTEPSRVD